MENKKLIEKLKGLKEEAIELKESVKNKCDQNKSKLFLVFGLIAVMNSLGACKLDDDIYFSPDLEVAEYMEVHDEEDCLLLSYINSAKENEKTFEEWNQQYIDARSSSIRDFDGIERASIPENDYAMRQSLYNMGLIISKAQIAETLGIDYKYIDKIEIDLEDESVTIEYRAFENKTSTGGIDTGMHTNNRETYDLSGEILDIVDVIINAKNNTLSEDGDLSYYDNAYRELNEFWLYKGNVKEGNIFSDDKLSFELEPERLYQFNQDNDPDYQMKLN